MATFQSAPSSVDEFAARIAEGTAPLVVARERAQVVGWSGVAVMVAVLVKLVLALSLSLTVSVTVNVPAVV